MTYRVLDIHLASGDTSSVTYSSASDAESAAREDEQTFFGRVVRLVYRADYPFRIIAILDFLDGKLLVRRSDAS